MGLVYVVSNLLAADAQYVGAAKCKMCHMSKSRGDQFGIWQKSKHADAYNVLATDLAKEVAKKAGIEGNPQEAANCLKCHVTAYEAPASAKAATLTLEEGVGCEVCHGPGSLYKSMKVMKDLAAGTQDAKAVAFQTGSDETMCKKCHNESSPTYKPFNYAEAQKLIAHPVPEK
ncbi:cytochrome C554 [candidate division KSB1 bacterium]|nr:cytochrome C554 [candidate division KSB1 bacterium]